jgi:hypothetical protein
MSFKIRLEKIIKCYYENTKKLSEALEYDSPAKLYRLLKDENNNPSFDILQDILRVHKKMSGRWLVTGEGDMEKETILVIEEKTEDRYIKLLEKTNEQQGRTIEIHEKCIEDLRSLNGGKKNATLE